MRTRIHSLIRFLTVLLLLGHASMALGQGMKILSGRVYEGPTGSEPPTAKPIEGVTVKLYGSQQAGVDDPAKIDLTFLRETTTDPENGWYGLEVYPSDAYDYFNIIETNKGTYVDSDPPGATAATNGGTVKSPNWIQYGYGDIFVFGKTLTGNKFWDKPVGQSENHPPVADDQPVYASEDTPEAITLTASDPDNNPLTWHLMSQPSHGTLSGTLPNLTYTPQHNYNGQDSFTFRVHDGLAYSNTATVTITIRPVNDPPVAGDDFYSVQAGKTLNIAAPGVLANDTDPEHDSLTAAKVSGPSHASSMTLNSDGSFTYTPTLGFSGQDSFTYTASDIHGSTDAATVNIVVSVAPPGTGVIKGFKFEDVDEQGDYDAAEPKMGGWTIYLDHWELVGGGVSYGWKQTGTATTKISGLDIGTYSFDSLAAGRYRVREEKKLNWVQTYPPGDVWEVTLSDGQVVENRDFGNYRPSPLLEEWDFGDAPDSYKTRYNNGTGAYHDVGEVMLGRSIDIDTDGQPGPLADGDDTNGDDEDGVTFVSGPTVGQRGQMGIVVSAPTGVPVAVVGWMDYNGNGAFEDRDERFVTITTSGKGRPELYEEFFPVPADAVPGWTYARVRVYRRDVGVYDFPSPTGYGGEGEVEDYRIEIVGQEVQDKYDYGDAPWDGVNYFYPEAWHEMGSVYLGLSVDVESGMQRNLHALGDDAAGFADEDGIEFMPEFVRGKTIDQITTADWILIRISKAGQTVTCGLWIDLNQDGDWNDQYEGAVWDFKAVYLCALFRIPANTPVGKTFMRLRVCDGVNKSLSPDGFGGVGEVEDYEIEIKAQGTGLPPGGVLPSGGMITGFKWYDRNGNGKYDIFNGKMEPPLENWTIRLAKAQNGKYYKQETTDKDGFFRFTGLEAGTYIVGEILPSGWTQTYPGPPLMTHTVRVDEPQPPGQGWQAYVVPFVQFGNTDGPVPGPGPGSGPYSVKFNDLNNNNVKDPGEPGLPGWEIQFKCWEDGMYCGPVNLVSSTSVTTGTDGLFALPVDSKICDCEFAVWEVPQDGWVQTLYTQMPDGTHVFGNYQTTDKYDYGDAPLGVHPSGSPYKYGVARHKLVAGRPYLGTVAPDSEAGMQLPGGRGDDDTGFPDDEDGVSIPPFEPTDKFVTVTVVASDAGFLNAWLDFDDNGDWGAGEQICKDMLLNPGSNTCTFTVPAGTKTCYTYARFRLSLTPGIGSSGLAPDGEVEDYLVAIGIPLGPTTSGPDEIGVSKWVDHDGDGKQEVDDFDIGLQGWGFWLDKNNNGVKDAGEPEDKTNSMGFLTFTGLTPGTYVVHEESLPGWKQTVPGNNGVYTVTLPLPAGQANKVLQFANQQTGGPGLPPGVALPPSGGVAPGGVLPPVPTLPPGYCIWGYKYNDLNGNGLWEPSGTSSEPVLPNWPIWLDTNNDGTPDGYTSTNASGVFIFAGLKPQSQPYTVGEETQVGWAQTYPTGGTHSVTIQPNQNSFTGILFGNQQTGGPGPGEGEKWQYLKWSQPVIEIDPKVGQTPVFCGWDEPAFSVQTSARQRRWTMVVDDFHCLGPIPVTSVRWWGSFAGWTDRTLPLAAPTVFHIGIWTGVPADTAYPWGRPEKLVWETTADEWTWEFAGYEQSATGPGTSVPAAGLVAHWKLDGDATDSAGTSHGTVRGNPVWATGKVDRALRLDGLDDYVELPIGSRISQLTSATVALWVNWSTAGGAWQRIFDFGKGTNAYMFLTPRVDTSGPMRFAITTGGSSSEQQVTAPTALAGGWHHVAVVIDAAARSMRLYLDGALVATNTAMTLTPSALGQTTRNWLGKSQYEGDGYYQGLIDDVLIYNRALSADEIKSLVAPAQQQTEEACFEFNHDLPTADWFHQERFQTQQEVFWISITAMYPGSCEGTNPWGWMSRPAGWNNGAVRFERTGAQLQPGLVLAPQGMAFVQDEVACGSVQDYDMAFELRTDPPWVKSDQPFTGLGDWPDYDDHASYATEATNGVVTIVQQVADDWPGVYPQDPVIAMAWEGSYIGYGYEACQCGPTVEPRRPDYFQLLIRANLPPDAGNPLDRPADVVWAYEVFDYDEVLVGYDRHPSGEPNEPVFRYSARLPRDKWFWHEGEQAYWLSIMAVYVARADQIKYPWGWTDHKHQFGSAASKLSSTNQGFVREPLSDPTGGLIDMSFTLYTTSESRPIAYWRFDETQGTIAVDSVGGHNGTIHGATWTTGAAGGALRFDGGDYVEVSDEADFDITGAITVAAWVSLEAVPAEWIGIVTKGDSTWRLSTLLSERRFHFAVNDPQGAFHAVDGTTSVGLNEWHHVVGTYDGSSIRLYVDEVEDPASPVAYTGPIHVDDFLVWIGANAERPGRGFVGRIDEVRVYDVALSQAEVLDLMALADNTAPGRSMPGR